MLVVTVLRLENNFGKMQNYLIPRGKIMSDDLEICLAMAGAFIGFMQALELFGLFLIGGCMGLYLGGYHLCIVPN